ncbi:RNA methyltransferase [Mycoplasma iguanae]|uniref:RNA methyltransferase n=1 Tax=Mycoplasma iguanae TaxID=292461 RepID=A0ABY5R9N9_9MOLU|nr:RNA methyltransferase [Mycoplasma iguanae]UVD81487.1 RNA methyltransferase [Mycoplasma iguanae]
MNNTLTNNKIKNYAKLKDKKYRNLWNLFIIEGQHLITEAQNSEIEILDILTSDPKMDGTLVNETIIKKISSSITPPKIIAICKKPLAKELKNKVILLDNLQDPGNVGNIIRNAKAFGFSDVIVSGVDIFNPKVIQASQGAIFQINCFNLKKSSEHFLQTKSANYQIIGSFLDLEAQQIDSLKVAEKHIIIFGNEGQGISKNLVNFIDKKIYIPIDFESLNVASAAAIILYKLRGNF